MKEIIIESPVKSNISSKLEPGNKVKIRGTLYTMRDATLANIEIDIKKKKSQFNIYKNTIIYFCGPSPAPKKKKIGSCGPTTTQRMEKYIPLLSKMGIKAIIGKGKVSNSFLELLKKYNIVYLLAVGGAGAYLTTFIKESSIIAYKQLGPEAIYQLEVEDFPCIVAANKGKQIFS